MTSDPQQPTPDEASKVEDLVFACLESEDFQAELEQQCAAHPELADRLRRVARRIHSEGLVGETDLLQPENSQVVAPKIPEQIGGHRLIKRLGEGGMGVVYLAEDLDLKRQVALKLVRPEQLFFAGARERFRREVDAIARLKHSGIVAIHRVGEEQGMPFYSMDYVDGPSLAQQIARLRGKDPARLQAQDLRPGGAGAETRSGDSTASANITWVSACLQLLREVAAALAHAHELGVLHRDVKPSNIILDRQGHPHLLDFGLARLEGSDQELTRSSSQLGSLPYMPPEALAGGAQPDQRFDVYGLGVTMYELLTLRSPYLMADAEQTRQRIMRGECATLRELNPSLGFEVQVVCATAMELNPARRYPDMETLLRDLDNLLARRPIEARPLGPLRRSMRWVQRHPTATVGMAALFVLALVAALFGAEQQRRARIARSNSYVLGLIAANAQLRDARSGDARRSLELCPEELRGFEWRHLNLSTDASEEVLLGHDGEVISLAIQPGTRRLHSGGADGTVRRWTADRAASEVLIRLPKGDARRVPFGNRVRSLQWDAGGSHLFVGCEDRTIRRYDQNGQQQTVLAEHRGAVTELAYHPERRLLASGSNKGGIKLIDPEQGLLADLRVPQPQQSRLGTTPVAGLAFSPDGTRLYAGNMQDLLVYDVAQRQLAVSLRHPVEGDAEWVFWLLALPDGVHVLTAGRRGVLHKWNIETGKRVACSPYSFLNAIESGTYDAEHGKVWVAGSGGPLAVCDPDTLRRETLLYGHELTVMDLQLEPSGEYVVSAAKDGTIRRWKHSVRQASWILGHHAQALRHLEVHPAGHTIYSADSSGPVMAWSLEKGPSGARPGKKGLGPEGLGPRRLATDTGRIRDIALDPGGRRLAVVGSSTLLIDLATTPSTRTLDVALPNLNLVAWSPDGTRLYGADTTGHLQALDPRSGEQVALRQHFADGGSDRIFGPLVVDPVDGALVAATATGRVCRFDAKTLEMRGELLKVGSSVRALTVDPRRRALLVASLRGEIHTIDIRNGVPLRPTVNWRGAVLNKLRLSPDGDRLFSASMSESIQVWEYPSMRQLALLRAHSSQVYNLRSSPDGQRLFSGSRNGVLRVWETNQD